MFDNACMYVLGLNERYVMCMCVAYPWKESWQHTKRQRDRQRERRMTIKHRGLFCSFLSKGAVWKKQDHSLQSFVWVQIKKFNLIFNFDMVLKRVVGMQ
jgi:hypothetical protein